MADHERVRIAEDPSSKLFHALGCRMFDWNRSAVLAREDAEDLGRRPAPCLRDDAERPDPDGGQAVLATDGGRLYDCPECGVIGDVNTSGGDPTCASCGSRVLLTDGGFEGSDRYRPGGDF